MIQQFRIIRHSWSNPKYTDKRDPSFLYSMTDKRSINAPQRTSLSVACSTNVWMTAYIKIIGVLLFYWDLLPPPYLPLLHGYCWSTCFTNIYFRPHLSNSLSFVPQSSPSGSSPLLWDGKSLGRIFLFTLVSLHDEYKFGG